MVLYVVTAARWNGSQLRALRCQGADGSTNRLVRDPIVMSVDAAIDGLNNGDRFELIFVTHTGKVSGGPIELDGNGSVRAQRGDAGRKLEDLPRF